MAVELLSHTCLSGSWQRALDGALLQRQQPVLRLYTWSRLTLSLGFHQRQLDPRWLDWQRRGQLDLVRRPSGGGAVLHGGDLCYALVLPCDRFERAGAYGSICRWLQRTFAELGEPLQFGSERADGNPDCFARSTAADLVNGLGIKRVGSAQRWQGGWLLQHGSILIQPQIALWRELFGVNPPVLPDLPVTTAELITLLLAQAQLHLPQAETDRGVELVTLEQAAMPWDAIGAQRSAYQVVGAPAP